MTPQFQMYLDAAVMQLMDENKDSPLSKDELAEQANDMARKQAIDMSINNAFYKVAVTGGVIDAIQIEYYTEDLSKVIFERRCY